jgi:hypothetical protein
VTDLYTGTLYDARRDTDIAIAPKVFARLEQWARTR